MPYGAGCDMNLEKIYKEEDFFPREITSYEKNTAVYTGKSTNETENQAFFA